jgi:hypothetical protein
MPAAVTPLRQVYTPGRGLPVQGGTPHLCILLQFRYTGSSGKKNANPVILLSFYWQGGRLAFRPDIT